MVADIVVAAAAAAATAAVSCLFVAAVADLQRNTVPGSKGWVDALLSPQILATQLSPVDPAADASALAVLVTDPTGAAVPPVGGAASAAASDDTAPTDDSRPPTAPLIDAAEGTVPTTFS